MATLAQQLQTLRPSASDLKRLGWPDWLVNDYLTLLENLILLASSDDNFLLVLQQLQIDLDALELRVDVTESNISALDTRVTTAEGEIVTLDGRVTVNEADIAQNALDIATHVGSNSEHGATGDIVGTGDYCTELLGGTVLRAALSANAVSSTATIALAALGAAPAAYSQAYAQSQSNLINDIRTKHNTSITDLNNAIGVINDIIAKAKTAKQMSI